MAVNINVILENYKNHDDIATELDNVDLENFLDFNNNGKYEFAHCGICSGPLLGHLKPKCSQLNNVAYEETLVKRFEDWLKTVKGFREAVNKRNKKKEKERNDIQVAQIRDTVKTIMDNMERKGAGDGNTTQLIKSRFPPIWSGQEFDRWRIEVEKWCDNNKSSNEDKYIDLLESLKKNDVIKDFVNRTLIEKVGETRTVKKVLDIMTEKFSKTTREKMSSLVNKISNFKADENVDKLIDKFEELITETDKLKLAQNLKYALSLMFIERLERDGKINANEKLRLRDVIEDDDGEPRVGNLTVFVRKDSKR